MTMRPGFLALALFAAAPLAAKGGGRTPMFTPGPFELFGPRQPGGNYTGYFRLSGTPGGPRSGIAEVVITAADGRALANGNHGFALNFNHPSKEIVFPVESVNSVGGCAPLLGGSVDVQFAAGGKLERHSVPISIRANPTDGTPGHCSTPVVAPR